jgi:hypothetical protein
MNQCIQNTVRECFVGVGVKVPRFLMDLAGRKFICFLTSDLILVVRNLFLYSALTVIAAHFFPS